MVIAAGPLQIWENGWLSTLFFSVENDTSFYHVLVCSIFEFLAYCSPIFLYEKNFLMVK